MRIAVAGSAHLDILAQVTGDPCAVDKVGRVSIEIGGTGANLAINLANYGHKTSLLTAMSASPYSKIVLDYLKAMNVHPAVEWRDELPLAAFCAQIDAAGDLETAISSMPVAHVEFSEASIESTFDHADAAIVECNLSVEQIEKLVFRARQHSIPVYLAAVSEEKAEKIAKLSAACIPDGIFMNRREFKRVAKSLGMSGAPVLLIAEQLNADLIVTNGKSPIEVAYAAGDADTIDISQIGDVVNQLGAGDSLMSGAIHHRLVHGVSWSTAIEMAKDGVVDVMKQNNCNLGSHSAMEHVLGGLQTKAEKDALSGLFNRGAATQMAVRAFEESRATGQTMAAVILDIDHFKSINDKFGHDVGDKVIQAVANQILQAVRADDIAARWGGEEFVCVLPGANMKSALRVSERIRQSIEVNVKTPRQVTVSVGVAELTTHTESIEELIKQADKALYIAKSCGRNKVVKAA